MTRSTMAEINFSALLYELEEYEDRADLLAHLQVFFGGRMDAEFFPDSARPVTNDDMRIYGKITDLMVEEAKGK